MWIANAIALALLYAGQADTVQYFVGDDGCYGDGTRWVVRHAVNECEHGDGGWGAATMACYTDGVQGCVCGVPVVLHCCSADLDMDGDVDLADWKEMEQRWTGPTSTQMP